MIAEDIVTMRDSRVMCKAGYDGEYGTMRLFTDDELAQDNSVGLPIPFRITSEEHRQIEKQSYKN